MVLVCGLYLDDGVEASGFEGYETGQSPVWHYPFEVIDIRHHSNVRRNGTRN